MNKIIIIYGPTAIGKTEIAVNLAKMLDAEIISCDSMQIYKNLNIGSAKITKEEMQGVNHYMLDIIEPQKSYSVYDYVNDCKDCINKIKNKNKNVIIVGGTGLYIKALTENYNYSNTQKNEELRLNLQDLSTEDLVNKLTQLGKTVKQDDKNNKARLIRYIEIALSDNKEQKATKFNNDYIIFGLNTDRTVLYERINKRVDKMIEIGLIDETKNLLKQVSKDSQCFKAIAYKELLPYINNEISLEECVNTLKQRTRNYAKRQITFMNQFKNLIKINVTSITQTTNEIYQIIKDKYE